MSRPRKQTVDYFPHQCSHGKTMFIIEQNYGNDGYAFWFKLLEMLGSTEGHALDLSKQENMEFLAAKTKLSSSFCGEIIDKLAVLGAIDANLWEEKIVWSDNFVDNISEVYRKRTEEKPVKPSFYRKKQEQNAQSGVENLQSKVKESIYILFSEFYSLYPRKVGKASAEKSFNKINPSPELFKTIMSRLRLLVETDWKGKDLQYIPHPATWLNGRRWEDEIATVEKTEFEVE